MLKIAICEDDCQVGADLKTLIEHYTAQHNKMATVFLYHNAEDLEEYCSEHACDFDIIFFDIIMEGMDGMTCAHHIRKQSRIAKFIFLTSSREYVFEGYEVNAFRYILKPLNQAKIFETLRQVLLEVSEIKNNTIDVKSHGKIHRIPLEDIVLAEIENNAIVLELANNQDSITLYEKLDDFLERVNYNFFIRLHKSYAVNFLYIETYKTDKIILKNNIALSISRTYKAEVRDRFFRLLHAEDE